MSWGDLHNHTKASDGEHTSTSIVELAQKLGIHALGVTDHDTISGIFN